MTLLTERARTTPSVAHPAGSLLPLVYSQLVTIESDDFTNAHRTNVAGDLAIGWESPEPTQIVFNLHPGVAWRDRPPVDGRTLTASDVKISHDALREAPAQQAEKYEVVDSIEADDANRTVSFHLAHPAAYLLAEMTSPQHVVFPPELIAEPNIVDVSTTSVGTGPFHLTLVVPGQQWSATRNRAYFKHDSRTGERLPRVDLVRGTSLYGATVMSRRDRTLLPDWIGGRVQRIALWDVADAHRALDAQPFSVLQVSPPAPGHGGCFTFRSLDTGPFADPRVRMAISRAIDRRQLARSVYEGLAAPDCAQNWTFVADPASEWGFREWPWDSAELGVAYRPDPTAANELLNAAGYSAASPLPIVTSAFRDPPAGTTSLPHEVHREVGRAAREQLLNTPGLNVTEQPGHPPDLVFRSRRTYGVDPDELAHGRMHSASRGNDAGINDAEIDAWSEAQRRAIDPWERSELLERIRLKEAEEVWRLHLVNPYGLAVRREHVFNLVDTYFSKNVETLPKQLERTWLSG